MKFLGFIVAAGAVIMVVMGLVSVVRFTVEGLKRPTPEKKSREINLTLNLEKGTEKEEEGEDGKGKKK
ncbi:MAG: hypothetical protein LUD72_03725 [Bacteroidales bacterium]|nr:hypothetical protein [Bacteroidales bacterium]